MLDMALQSGGHVETVLALAVASELSVTDRLEDGQELTIPEQMEYRDARTVKLYGAYGIEPATEASIDDMLACPYGGINFMGVDVDFIVS